MKLDSISGPNIFLTTLVSVLVTYVKDEGKIIPLIDPYHTGITNLNPCAMDFHPKLDGSVVYYCNAWLTNVNQASPSGNVWGSEGIVPHILDLGTK